MITKWCEECAGFREVVDESIESALTGYRTETDFKVVTFACGHDSAAAIKDRHLLW